MARGGAAGGMRGDTSGRGADETGAATLEYVGMTVLVVVLVLGVLLTPAGPALQGAYLRAVCKVTSSQSCGLPATTGPTPLQRATGGRYVAMGDSYSSGEGAWDYQEGTDFDDRNDLWPFNDDEESHNRCHRSDHAYSKVVAGANHFAHGYTFVACSGAVTSDLDHPNHNQTGEDPQLAALGDDVSLVTLTVGGNDLGFADILTACIENGARGVPLVDTCQEKYEPGFQGRLDALQKTLLGYYAKIKERAPAARIVVVGYPRLFPDNPQDSYGNLLFKEDQVWMNQKADVLNAMLRETARQAGVEFVDPTEAFSGHGIGSDDPWINDLDFGGPGVMIASPSSFHPNARGHAAIAQLLQQQLEHPRYP